MKAYRVNFSDGCNVGIYVNVLANDKEHAVARARIELQNIMDPEDVELGEIKEIA